MFWLIFLFTILFKTWNSLQFQSFMHISHRPRLEEMWVVSSFMILSIKLISPQRFGWVWALNQKQNSSRHKGEAMESDCPSHCELKLPCYAQHRCQKHIELTLQHPGAANDSGFQLWSSNEQNKLLHKLVKAACAPQVMVRTPGHSCWMTTRDVSALYVQQWGVFNSLLFSPRSQLCTVFAVFSNWATKKSIMYAFVFVTPGQWARHKRDFLGTDFGSVSSSWFQGRDHGLKDATAMDWLPGRALSLLSAYQNFIVESSFVLGKRNYQSEFHAALK